ncbi:MAG TPA: hypothetical protein VFG55_08305, partial [Rhodanobacteraceae bacterium]|nr:hypothetical protein [Rhodanobacteraceae bacterium]
GQGLLVDIAPEQSVLFATWYTYAPASEGLTGAEARRWFAMQASYVPGDLAFGSVPIYTATGGVFDQPGDVTRQVVGSANLTFTSCNTMIFDYIFDAGEFAGLHGTINEQRLTPAPGCE